MVGNIILGLLVIFIGLVLVYLAASLILKFDRARIENRNKIKLLSKSLDDTNKQLDETIDELHKLNAPLEGINKIFKRINSYFK